MARERDYRAEYAARKARAAQQGYTGYRQQRTQRATGRPRATDPVARTQQQRVAGQTVTQSGSPDAIRAALQAAARSGQTVDVFATFDATRADTGDHWGPRSRWVEGADPQDVLDLADDEYDGDVWDAIADLWGDAGTYPMVAGGPPIGPVTVVAHGLFGGGGRGAVAVR